MSKPPSKTLDAPGHNRGPLAAEPAQALVLIKAFARIGDPGLRQTIIDLVQKIADSEAEA